MYATQQLKDEHEGVLAMLEIIEAMLVKPELSIAEFEQVVDFLRVFVDRCHHGKEEEILFPALERAGIPKNNGPIGVMLAEHQTGRDYIQKMNEALGQYRSGQKTALAIIRENAGAYIQLLRNHIQKENNILFAMADQVLNESRQQELLAEFNQIELDRIGLGKHEQYHRMIDQMTAIYL